MKTLRYLSYYIIPVIITCFIWPSGAFSEPAKESSSKTPSIVIKANTLEVDNNDKVVTFTGDVDAKKDDFTITCQRLRLHYRGMFSSETSEKFEVEQIIATGKVKITQTDGGYATAEKAVYNEKAGKFILTGQPMVKQGNDFVEGAKITLFLNEKRSIVEGSKDKRVRAVIFPKE